MDQADLLKANATGRLAIGAALLAVPGVVGASWLGRGGDDDHVKVLVRAVGARDLALGAGLLSALSAKAPTQAWTAAAALADAVDAGATLAGWSSLSRSGRVLVLAVAAGSAIQMGVLAATADS